MGIEEKDFKEALPEEPGYKETIAELLKKRKLEEYDKLPKGLRDLAELADELTEFYDGVDRLGPG